MGIAWDGWRDTIEVETGAGYSSDGQSWEVVVEWCE